MTQEISSKTVSEIEGSVITISCFADMNSDNTTTPELFRSDVLLGAKKINDIEGKGGDLMLTSEIENMGVVNGDGELTIKVKNDDANKYSNDATNGELTYNNG